MFRLAVIRADTSEYVSVHPRASETVSNRSETITICQAEASLLYGQKREREKRERGREGGEEKEREREMEERIPFGFTANLPCIVYVCMYLSRPLSARTFHVRA